MKRNYALLLVIASLVIVSFARLIEHPFNFTPLVAMSIFGVYQCKGKWYSFLLPLVAIFFSDVLVNVFVQNTYLDSPFAYFTTATPYVGYVTLLLIGCLGLIMKNAKATTVTLYSLIGSLVFYLVTNTSAWIVDPANLYSNDLAGLAQCLYAGIPFYKNEITGSFFLNQIAGDLFFNGVLFGMFALATNKIKSLQTA